MKSIQDLMIELDGADPETVNQIAWKEGSLPVRLAMLGLASIRKGETPLWWGYPPGVFIGYKWSGQPMHDLVVGLAESTLTASVPQPCDSDALPELEPDAPGAESVHDADDLVAFDARKNEPTMAFEDFVKELKRHGKI